MHIETLNYPLAHIPAGAFTMGTIPTGLRKTDPEEPQRSVLLDAYAIGNSDARPKYRILWRRYFDLPSTPTLSHFTEAIRDLQLRDATARDVHVPVASVRYMLSLLGANVVAKDYGYPSLEAMFAAAGFPVQGKGERAVVCLHDLT